MHVTHPANIEEHALERAVLVLSDRKEPGVRVHSSAGHVLVSVEGVCKRAGVSTSTVLGNLDTIATRTRSQEQERRPRVDDARCSLQNLSIAIHHALVDPDVVGSRTSRRDGAALRQLAHLSCTQGRRALTHSSGYPYICVRRFRRR